MRKMTQELGLAAMMYTLDRITAEKLTIVVSGKCVGVLVIYLSLILVRGVSSKLASPLVYRASHESD